MQIIAETPHGVYTSIDTPVQQLDKAAVQRSLERAVREGTQLTIEMAGGCTILPAAVVAQSAVSIRWNEPAPVAPATEGEI